VPESAEKILEDAQAAYVRGERQKAIELALQVTSRNNPTEVVKAWRFIGSAACSVRSATLATRAYNNLAAPEHKQLLSELCKRNGLAFHDGQFSTE
jgi:cytochrome c-type biogenesis protein CcmH/NrfG